MLKYYSSNIESSPLFLNVKNRLELFDNNNFKTVWRLYMKYCDAFKRTIGDVSFNKDIGAINVMGIKRDPEIHFNLPGAFYNDLLVVSKNTINGPEFYVYKVTMDPKAKKHKIAHLLLGMYDSYKVRPHRWISTRPAICQDRNDVLIARTDIRGNIINATPYNGLFGINIHDSDRFVNTSLGCTVLERDSDANGHHYEKSYKPLLKSISNKNKIVYAVANLDVLSRLSYALSLGKDLEPLSMEKLLLKIPVMKNVSFINRHFLKG